METTAFETMMKIRDATITARAQTGRATISTRVQAGMYQIVDVTFDTNGISTVVPLSGWLEANDTIAALRQMQAE